MVDKCSAVFQALSHEVRRGMIHRLSEGEMTVGQLAEPLAMSLAAASKHVQILEAAGLVERRVEGRRHVCRLVPQPLEDAFTWLRSFEHFWAGTPREARSLPLPGQTWEEETD